MRRIEFSDDVRRGVDASVRGAAASIIAGKGATYYGIGGAVARIADAILRDHRSVLTVSAPTADVLGVPDVSLSPPRLLGGDGVLETFPLPLNDPEQQGLRQSAEVIRSAIESLS